MNLNRTARNFSLRAKNRNQFEGFTLVELLVVIAIVAILAAVVVLIINPLELTKRSRDAARLTDLANLQQSINVAVQESTNSGQYLLCGGQQAQCGQAYTTANATSATRASDGTGWVKVDLSSANAVSVPTLPIDPVNSGANVYTYQANAGGTAWEINAVLESQQQAAKMQNDGGNNSGAYEVGSVLTIIP